MHNNSLPRWKPLLSFIAALLWTVAPSPSTAATQTDPVPGVAAHENVVAKPNQKIEIFVTAWCPYCQRLEKFLKANNVSYKRFDIEKDGPDANRRYRELGGGGVPIIKIGTQIIRGFDEAYLRTALEIK
ncbi:MAG: hypothetical protein IT290_12955 [Deltaproteobacteria bacterium]|nr:hypothetical protein [Deltaproteobacteria bacterium]